MKKLFFVAAMAAMALSSCSKNEVDSASIITQGSDAIGFDTFVGVSTRGLITDNTASTSGVSNYSIQDGFGVMGYYHSAYSSYSTTAIAAGFSTTSTPDFMNNTKVTYASNQWIYSPVKYWPNNTLDRISFFAYAPYETEISSGTSTTGATNTAGVTLSESGTPVLSFTVNSKPEAMTDLVADMIYNVAKEDNVDSNTAPTTTDGKVSFTLNHLLCRATIYAQLADDIIVTDDAQDASYTTNSVNDTRVFITNLSLVGTDASSDARYDLTGVGTKKSTGFRQKANYNVTASTSTVANATDYTGATVGDYLVDYVLGAWDYTATAASDGYTATMHTAHYPLIGTTASTTNDSDITDGIVAIANLDDDTDANDLAACYIGTTSNSSTASNNAVTGYNINNKYEVKAPTSNTDTYTAVFKGNQYLFLIPQQTAEVTYLYVEYDVVTPDANLALGYSKVTNYAVVSLAGLDTQGTAYRYNLEIGLSSVKVSADVESWGDEVVYEADLETDLVTTTQAGA